MKKTILFFIVLAIFTSCYKNNLPEDIKLFYYNESAGIRSLDPAFARDQANIWAVNQVFNGLVQLNDSLEIKPCIAKSWIVSDDKKTYTFNIRNDIYFHNSIIFGNKKRKLTAFDVDFSMQRLFDEKTASPGKWVLNNVAVKDDGKLDITVPNDTTVSIKLKKPFAPFLSLLSMQYCYIVPHEAVDYYGKDFGRNPVGTGPFFLKYWKDGVKMVLLKNPDYFETDSLNNKLPYLDGVVITFIVEKHTAFMEFMQGHYDMISGIDPNYKDVLLDANGNMKEKYLSQFHMTRVPYLNTEYLGILIGDKGLSALQNRNIRLAINLGFDRKKMMQYLRNNIGYPALYGFIPPGLKGYEADTSFYFEYNPQKAKELLAEAGYSGNNKLPEILLQTTGSYLDLCEYIQSQLKEIGINIKLDVVPPATLRELVAQSKSTFFRASWIADYPDAENYLSLFYSKNKSPFGPNYTLFSNKEYDELYEQAIITTSDSSRHEIYKQMNKIIMQESPIISLYYDMAVRFINNRIKGLEPNSLNLLILKTVKKD